MKLKMKKYVKGIAMIPAGIIIGGLFMGCFGGKPQTRQEVETYVATHVPEKASIVDYEVLNENDGKQYHYTFKSDSRDLEFDAYSATEPGSFGRYSISEFYSLAVFDYYKEQMRDTLAACPQSEMYNSADSKKVSMKMYMKNYSDAQEIAKTIAECNVIISDQWNYTPGADITDRNICGGGFSFYSSAGSSERLGVYRLNGKDDETAVYNELIEMLN